MVNYGCKSTTFFSNTQEIRKKYTKKSVPFLRISNNYSNFAARYESVLL